MSLKFSPALLRAAMAPMPDRLIPGTGVRTRFVKPLTDATACINFALIKDHSICGYTGALKNMTHGCSINPHDFHVHHASPQIALLYAQDVIKSRVRLHITDAFKVMAQQLQPVEREEDLDFPTQGGRRRSQNERRVRHIQRALGGDQCHFLGCHEESRKLKSRWVPDPGHQAFLR